MKKRIIKVVCVVLCVIVGVASIAFVFKRDFDSVVEAVGKSLNSYEIDAVLNDESYEIEAVQKVKIKNKY